MSKKIIQENKNDVSRFDTLFIEQEKYKPIWLNSQRLYKAQFTQKQYKKLEKKKRSKIFVPVTRNTVNIIKAIFATAFFSNGNPIELRHTTEKEKELISDRNKVLTYYYDKYKPAKELIKAFHSALLFRMGIVMTYWCSIKKKVITTQIPITDIAFDFECSNIDDIEDIGHKQFESARVVKQKIKNGFYNESGIYKNIFEHGNLKNSSRFAVKVLYKRTNKGWISKTFIAGILVRTAKLKRLPFQFGHALSELADVEPENRKDEILCYGGDIPHLIEPLQDEINHKRNIKNDIQEKILNPDMIVGDKADVDPNDLNFGHGKRIRAKGDINQVRDRAVPSEHSINIDLQILAGDIQSATGVNSIQEGQTGASDRRSADAMSVINANSSLRIEEMIMLINDTLFHNWARSFVQIVMDNADDDVIAKITGKDDFPLGKKGSRDTIEHDLKINFGMTLDKQKRINDKLQALQMISQNPTIKPQVIEKLLREILILIDGDDSNYDDIFNDQTDLDDQNNPPEKTQEQIDAEQIAKNVL